MMEVGDYPHFSKDPRAFTVSSQHERIEGKPFVKSDLVKELKPSKMSLSLIL